jgi:ketosteroid isomerase-like protein
MSQENVEILKRTYAAFDRRDRAAPFEHDLHPDITIQMSSEVPEGPITFRGPEGAGQIWAALDATFEDYRAEVIQMIPTGDCVVVHCRQSGRIAGGGTRVEGDIFHAWWFRDAKAIAMRHFSTRSEALEAVGLSEQDISGPILRRSE